MDPVSVSVVGVGSEPRERTEPLEIAWLFRGESGTADRSRVTTALEHLRIWRSVAARAGNESELVVEAGGQPGAALGSSQAGFVDMRPPPAVEFDVALLGYRGPADEDFDAHPAGPRLEPIVWERYLGGSSAYLLSPAGARKLLGLVDRFGLPFEVGDLLMRRGRGLRVLACHPPLARGDSPTPDAPGPSAPPPCGARRRSLGDIAIYAGQGWARWHPVDIVSRGLGGSETAAFRVAEALAKRGYAVTIYADFESGVVADVRLRHWTSFEPAQPRRAVISLRDPAPFDHPDLAGETNLLWVQDVDFGDRLSVERGERIDRILLVSDWHRDRFARRYPHVAAKLSTVRNGITPDYFTRSPPPARARRVLYSSSPDRGLDLLLELWPLVREQVPDARLLYTHAPVYDHAADGNPALGGLRDRIRSLAEQPGVSRREGLSQPELALTMRSSLVWAHPSYATLAGERFLETSCIGAMEAQAAGCCVVAGAWGALTETVRVGTLVDGDPAEPRFKERFAEAIVAALTDSELHADAQLRGPEAALPWDWEGTAALIAAELEG